LRRRRRKELGRSEIATTSRFYAKWIDTEHQQPRVLDPTDVYADFLAKLEKSHHSPTIDEFDHVRGIENLVESQDLEWNAGTGSSRECPPNPTADNRQLCIKLTHDDSRLLDTPRACKLAK
jgi:hypothetical protein